jgi:hypothetical protein
VERETGITRWSNHLPALDGVTVRVLRPWAAAIAVTVRGIPRISGLLGRHVGDYVIAALAARLNGMTLPGSLRCRLDHNHYAIYLPEISDPLEPLIIAKEIIGILSQPVDWVDRTVERCEIQIARDAQNGRASGLGPGAQPRIAHEHIASRGEKGRPLSRRGERLIEEHLKVSTRCC